MGAALSNQQGSNLRKKVYSSPGTVCHKCQPVCLYVSFTRSHVTDYIYTLQDHVHHNLQLFTVFISDILQKYIFNNKYIYRNNLLNNNAWLLG